MCFIVFLKNIFIKCLLRKFYKNIIFCINFKNLKKNLLKHWNVKEIAIDSFLITKLKMI